MASGIPTLSNSYFLNIAFLCALTFFLFYPHEAQAHSFLLEPRPYKYGYDIGIFPNGCSSTECRACPALKFPLSDNFNTEQSPERTVGRGERIRVVWARNNHHGGMIRLAFVPPGELYDKTRQTQLAFYHGCSEQGRFDCRGLHKCEDDLQNTAFHRYISIPSNLPDGVYVFSFMWYGGLDSDLREKYADYYSCSYIRVQGGAALTSSYQPFFDGGAPSKYVDSEGKCLSSTDFPGKCIQRKQCDGGPPGSFRFPREYESNNRPRPILASEYGGNPDIPESPKPLPSPTQTPRPIASETPPFPGTSQSPKPSIDVNVGKICSGQICCPETCGKCGGSGCSQREGGSFNCCTNVIMESGRYCELDPAPCIKS